MTNTKLYRKIPNIPETIRWRRAQFAGHCSESKEVVRELVTW